MYNKKYILEKVEEFNGHNYIYDDVEGCVAFPAYFNVGERGWFLYIEDDGWFQKAHRIHTSTIKNVEYFNDMEYEGDYIIVETNNTRLKFRVIGK